MASKKVQNFHLEFTDNKHITLKSSQDLVLNSEIVVGMKVSIDGGVLTTRIFVQSEEGPDRLFVSNGEVFTDTDKPDTISIHLTNADSFSVELYDSFTWHDLIYCIMVYYDEKSESILDSLKEYIDIGQKEQCFELKAINKFIIASNNGLIVKT